ncbi:MAG: hypothetical protein LBQ14_07900 [Treponema sp.]|jgi:hypothetical protein|nr:hypothetical protein [Treponema sp.]
MKFPWKRGNAKGKTEEEIRRIFQRVFLSADGQEVLRILLNDWSYFDICDTEQKRVLNDYAKIFLHEKLGLHRIVLYTELDKDLKAE